MSTIFRTLLLASSVAAWVTGEAAAAEYQCRKVDSSVRIAIEVKKAGHTLPCEVVVEDDRGERAVLYSAQYDRDYCPSRIEKTRSELEQDGWACEKTADQNIVRNEDVPPAGTSRKVLVQEKSAPGSGGALVADNGNVITGSRQCRRGDNIRRIRIEVENATSGKPCELIYWADGDQSKAGQLLWRAEHDATFCPRRLDTIVDKWISDGWSCDASEPQTAAIEVSPIPQSRPGAVADEAPTSEKVQAGAENTVESPNADLALEAVIAADAERIGEWMEVEPAIEIAARGDLNGDGSDDAVVFLAYQSDQAAYRQYLMSYLVDDDGYELASVKLLTDVRSPPAQARVEQIDKGVIWLTLPDEDGVASQQTGYRLQDQQLVEVDAQSPTNTNN
ncbi:MAG: hypothetical protein ACR2RF_13295 [Geminicoccaceae bacterium]